MPILGLIDAATFANTVAVTINSPTVTKNAADEIAAGDIIVLGGVRYFVKAVVSDTEITLGTDYTGVTNAALAGAQRRTAPKALADYIIRGGDSAAGDVQIIGVSLAEAQLSNNKSRGISGPGWWAYRTYTDSAGSTRHKSECIASFKDGSRVSGDFSDDAVAADLAVTITITTQPTDVTATVGVLHSMVVGAISTPPGDDSLLTYQWQKLSDDGRWEDVAGETGKYLYFNTYVAGDAGTYRAKVNSTNGAAEVISNSATATTA